MMQFNGGSFFNFKKLLSSPVSLFIYGILAKWYVMVSIATLVVTFWVFKGLEKSGALATAKNIVSEALEETKAIAKYCTPKITNPSLLWECLDNPPKYQPSAEEKALEKKYDFNQPDNSTIPNSNPYD